MTKYGVLKPIRLNFHLDYGKYICDSNNNIVLCYRVFKKLFNNSVPKKFTLRLDAKKTTGSVKIVLAAVSGPVYGGKYEIKWAREHDQHIRRLFFQGIDLFCMRSKRIVIPFWEENKLPPTSFGCPIYLSITS